MDPKLLLLIVALKLVPADIDALRLQFNDNPAVAIKRDANEQVASVKLRTFELGQC